jgi:hypothetical protein
LPVVAITGYFGSVKTIPRWYCRLSRALICVVDEANFGESRRPESRWRSPNIADPVVVHFVQHVARPPVEPEDWTENNRRSRLLFVTRGLAQTGGPVFRVDRHLCRRRPPVG